MGYKSQFFYKAIEKYGWENIRHKILLSNLSKEEARQKEIEYISIYKSNTREYGYNLTDGGDLALYHRHYHKVAKYAPSGELIQTYNNRYEAQKDNNLPNSNVNNIYNGKITLKNGYMFIFYDNEPPSKIDPYKASKNTYRILQYDLDGNFLNEFINGKDVEKYLNIKNGQMLVLRACKSGHVAYGYQWRYRLNNIIQRKIEPVNYYYAYTIDGEYIDKFFSFKDAIEKLNIESKTHYLPKYKLNHIYFNDYFGYRWTNKCYDKLPPLYNINGQTYAVAKIDKNTNEVIDVYLSITEAVKDVGIDNKSISWCCQKRKNFNTAKGYRWEYIQNIKESQIRDSFLLDKYRNYLLQYEELEKYLRDKRGEINEK